MRVLALVSGGKDSCFSIHLAARHGHEVVALGNLRPIMKNEMDSFMYQTVGHEAIDAFASALELPLFRIAIEGEATQQHLHYAAADSHDEVESLFTLLSEVKRQMPQVEAVCSGAIFSDYQRNRIENVCARLGLVSLAYMWRLEQRALAQEMVESELDVVLIKVAAMGLDPHKHLGRTLAQLFPMFCDLNTKYGINICGEGGEYESFTRDAPFFKRRIVFDDVEVVMHSSDPIAPVGYLHIRKYHLEDKPTATPDYSPVIIEVPLAPHSSSSPVACPVGTPFRQAHHYFRAQVAAATEGTTLQEQFQTIMAKCKEELARVGMDFSHTFFVFVYLQNMAQFGEMNAEFVKYFSSQPPSRATVELPLSRGQVMVECLSYRSPLPPPPVDIATTDEYSDTDEDPFVEVCKTLQRTPSKRTCLHVQSISSWAPACIGPYSQANSVADIVHVAGQIALNPPSLTIIETTFAAQLTLCFRHLERVMNAVSAQPQSALLVTVYVTVPLDGPLVEEVNQQFEQWISDSPFSWIPLMKIVQVPHLPRSALAEVQAISLVSSFQAISYVKADSRDHTVDGHPVTVSQITVPLRGKFTQITVRTDGKELTAVESLLRGLSALVPSGAILSGQLFYPTALVPHFPLLEKEFSQLSLLPVNALAPQCRLILSFHTATN